jgi:16S rRNA processing protein RimM
MIMDIGLILEAFGIKGEVKILSLNDEPERFCELKSIAVGSSDESESAVYKIQAVRVHKGYALVKFEGIDTRTDAEALAKKYVSLVDGDLTDTEKARIEHAKLIGLEVVTINGDRLGVIEEVILTGANDVYEVRDGKKTVLLPAISDVIKSVDLENRCMVVDPLPGLL